MLIKDKQFRYDSKAILKIFEKYQMNNNQVTLCKKDFDCFDQNNILSFTIPNRNKNFVGREKIIKELHDLIFKKKEKLILICSEYGNGKTSIALEYTHRLIEMNKNIQVGWIKSYDSNLEQELLDISSKLNIDTSSLDRLEIINQIKNRLFYKKFLFIFDDYEDFTIIEKYLHLRSSQDNVTIIINTNANNIGQKYKMKRLEIDGFNRDECFDYIKKMLEDRLDVNIEELFNFLFINANKFTNPFVLTSLIAFLKDKTGGILKVSTLINELKSKNEQNSLEKSPETKLINIILNENVNTNEHILKYTTLLDPDHFVPIDIYFNLFQIDNRQINSIAVLLSNLNILKETEKETLIGIKINKCFHEIIKKYFIVKSSSEFDVLINKIKNYFNKYFVKNEYLSKIEKHSYYCQLKNIIDYLVLLDQIEVKKKLEILNLFIKFFNNEFISNENLEFYKDILNSIKSNIVLSDTDIPIEIKKYYSTYSFSNEEINQSSKNLKDINKRHQFSQNWIENGDFLSEIKEFDKALIYFQKYLSIFQKNKENLLDTAVCLMKIGEVYISLNKYDSSLDYFLKSFQILKHHGERLELAKCLYLIGICKNNSGNYLEAVDYYEKCLVIYKNLKNNVECAKVYKVIGISYFNLGKYNKALNYYEKCLDVQNDSSLSMQVALLFSSINQKEKSSYFLSKYLNSSKLNTLLVKNEYLLIRLSFIYFNNFEIEKALVNCKMYKLEFINNKSFSNNFTRGEYYLLNGLIDIYYLKQFLNGIQSIEKCLEIFQKIFLKENNFRIAKALDGLGYAYLQLKNYDKAKEYFDKSLILYSSFYEENLHINIATLYEHLAEYYNQINYQTEKNEFFTNATKIRKLIQILGENLIKNTKFSY